LAVGRFPELFGRQKSIAVLRLERSENRRASQATAFRSGQFLRMAAVPCGVGLNATDARAPQASHLQKAPGCIY
jgi:hypothetical protein